MGKRGPKKKPTALRVFEGNPSKRPIPENEPQPEGIAKKPDDLGPIASQTWDQTAAVLGPINLLTAADEHAFITYCHAWEDYTTAKADCAKHGEYCIDQNGKSVLSAPYRRMEMAFQRRTRHWPGRADWLARTTELCLSPTPLMEGCGRSIQPRA